MKPLIYSSSDYASIDTGKFKAYYGYEETDQDTDEWCFVVYKNNKEVFRRINSELLDIACGNGPEAMLIAGLALYLGK